MQSHYFGRYYHSCMDFFARTALLFSVGFFLAMLVTRAGVYAAADGIILGPEGFIGGDFLAFWTSSKALLAGNPLDMYDRDIFEAALSQTSGLDKHYMMWQYPPTAFLLLPGLGLFGYELSYWIWMAFTSSILLLTLRFIGIEWRYSLMVFCAPLSLMVLNSGQISFLTSALLIVAAYFANSRPIIAGIAAGLLTIKPQLGILLPVVFLVAGCWRSFLVAAVTACMLAFTATLAFGVESWAAFFDSITRIYDDFLLDGGATPATNMTTLMSQMKLLGVGEVGASIIHYSGAIAIAGLTVLVWKKLKSADLRMALLCSAAILITPYAYTYEMIVLCGPICVLIQRAMKTGWLVGERPVLLIGVIFSASYDVIPFIEGVQMPFWLTLLCFLAILRRCLLEVGDTSLRMGFGGLFQPRFQC